MMSNEQIIMIFWMFFGAFNGWNAGRCIGILITDDFDWRILDLAVLSIALSIACFTWAGV